jgi:hypothetical protein
VKEYAEIAHKYNNRACESCGLAFEVMWLCGTWIVAHPGDDAPEFAETCPGCGGSRIVRLVPEASGRGINLGGEAGVGRHFPYYDRALNTWVRSHQHRRWLMTHNADGTDRAVKLAPTDGAVDFEELGAEEARAIEEEDRAWKAQQDYLENGPDRAQYHRAMDIYKQLPMSYFEEGDDDARYGRGRGRGRGEGFGG